MQASGQQAEVPEAPNLAAAVIEFGLVGELRMFRVPVVVGGGTPFLPPVTEVVPLGLVETRTFGSRVIYERFRQTRTSRTETDVRAISVSPDSGVIRVNTGARENQSGGTHAIVEPFLTECA